MVWAASVAPGDELDELETSKQEALDCAQEAARGARSVAGMADIARRSLLRPKGVFQVGQPETQNDLVLLPPVEHSALGRILWLVVSWWGGVGCHVGGK